MSLKYPTVYPTSQPTDTDETFIDVERALAAFLLIGVALGNLTEYFFEKVPFPIPFHVVVFFEGVVVSIILTLVIQVGTFESIISTPNISTDLIIYVFLPALLFGETMNMNWHHVTSGFNQYMLLAGPGALFGGLVTASIAYLVLPYGWSWQLCFLFGAVLSATDPVSVIALLKTTGASNKLTTVIVGESLFNDGAAMVFFFFFYSEQKYFANAGLFVEFCIKMVIGSPTVGIVCGLISHKLMRYFDQPTNNHIDIQITITIACAYISFFIAEGPCEMSGVLSCCSAGLLIAWLGSPKLLDDSKMHAVWANLEWLCNTLIFFLAGLIACSNAIADNAGSLKQGFWSLVLMYGIIMVVRFCMIFSFYPLLKDIGFKTTFKEAIFIAFSGLHGALGICLSLVVQSNFSDATNFFFLIAGISACSLLFNGSSAKICLRFLGLIEDPNEPKSPQMLLLLKKIKRSIRFKVKGELELIKNELGDYNPDEVNKLCRSMRGSLDIGDVIGLESTLDMMKKLKAELANSNVDINGDRYYKTDNGDGTNSQHEEDIKYCPDLLGFIRSTFLNTLEARYWDSIRTGKLGIHAYSAKLLLYSVDVSHDYIHDDNFSLADWNCIENGLKVNIFYYEFCRQLDDLFAYFGYFPGYASYAEAKRERMAIYTLLNYIDAHTFAQSKIHEYLGSKLEKNIDQNNYDDDSPEEALVRQQSKQSVERAKAILSLIPESDVKAFCTSRAARIVILKQLEVIESMLSVGALSKKSADLIYQSIEDDSVQVTIERDSIHRSFLKQSVQRKLEEDREIRLSGSSGSSSNSLNSLTQTYDENSSFSFKPSKRLSFRNSQTQATGTAEGTEMASSPRLNTYSTQTNPILDQSVVLSTNVETKQEDSTV